MLPIKQKVELWYIEGADLRAHRLAAGLSQRALADLIKAAIGGDNIDLNETPRRLNQRLISRDMEKKFKFGTNKSTAKVIQKILS